MKTRLALLLCVAGVSGYAQSLGTFTATGDMTMPRLNHLATLLTDGKVLISGGISVCYFGGPCVAADGAEIYDPIAGVFTAVVMTIARPTRGALLPDGRVLFAEGNFTGALAGVELYDPSTASFNPPGNAATLTAVYSATVLNDGRALLTGRAGTSVPPLDAAELYDAGAGTFSPIANWPQQIGSPGGVLADGRVQFYSGIIYDPATGIFSDSVISAANLNGLLDHFDNPPVETLLLNAEVLLTGGNTDGGNVNSAELYNPATDALSVTGSMSAVRNSHSATLLPDGTVLVAGGGGLFSTKTGTIPAIAGAEIYDPASGNFSGTASLIHPRFGHAAVVLNTGQVLITGGSLGVSSTSDPAMSSAEIYTPAVPVPAPALFSLSGDGRGQGAIWHAATGEIASPGSPAVAEEILSMYTTSLVDGSVIPPQVAVGGRFADILYFGDAPGYPGYYQVNFRVPNGAAPGSAVPVRLTYIGRPSNAVTIGVQ
jgi:hypothetical protein